MWYTVRTTTGGGTTSGDAPIGSSGIEIRPAAKITIDSTAAKIGRSMKNLEKSMALFLALAPPPAKAGGGWEGVVTARTLPSGSRRRCRNPSPDPPCLPRGGSRKNDRKSVLQGTRGTVRVKP